MDSRFVLGVLPSAEQLHQRLPMPRGTCDPARMREQAAYAARPSPETTIESDAHFKASLSANRARVNERQYVLRDSGKVS
jgi:hypothetical protein